MIWKICCSIFAAMAAMDAIIALHEFQKVGDLHIAWAGNSLIAAAAWLVIGFSKLEFPHTTGEGE